VIAINSIGESPPSPAKSSSTRRTRFTSRPEITGAEIRNNASQVCVTWKVRSSSACVPGFGIQCSFCAWLMLVKISARSGSDVGPGAWLSGRVGAASIPWKTWLRTNISWKPISLCSCFGSYFPLTIVKIM